jgi:hypothetical protein
MIQQIDDPKVYIYGERLVGAASEAKPETFGCVGNTIRCASGIYFDYAAPRAEMIDLLDIAQGLANECRFARQIDRFYSVAEHSIECANFARERGLHLDTVRNVFCHDFAEAYIGDIPKPLKIMLPELKTIERRIDRAIEERFAEWGLKLDLNDPVIKAIDWAMLFAERNALFACGGDRRWDEQKWAGEDQVEKIEIQPKCLCPEDAVLAFLSMARDLGIPV